MDEAPEGFDEIEAAFARVSMVADNILDSINDDSLRGRERKRDQATKKRTTAAVTISKNYVSDSDDGMKEDCLVLDHARKYQPAAEPEDDDSAGNYSHSDVSSLDDLTFTGGDESVDGSLVHDVHNLKSVARAMREEIEKQEEAFHANVTSDNGQSFFQKLEDAKAAKDAKAMKTSKPKIRNNVGSNGASTSHRQDAPKTISIRSKNKVPILSSAPKQKRTSLLDELQRFCDQVLGKSPNLPFLVANMVVWLLLFKCMLAAKGDQLIDGDGRLRMAFAS